MTFRARVSSVGQRPMRRGFTLLEVLAVLLSLVLPFVLQEQPNSLTPLGQAVAGVIAILPVYLFLCLGGLFAAGGVIMLEEAAIALTREELPLPARDAGAPPVTSSQGPPPDAQPQGSTPDTPALASPPPTGAHELPRP